MNDGQALIRSIRIKVMTAKLVGAENVSLTRAERQWYFDNDPTGGRYIVIFDVERLVSLRMVSNVLNNYDRR